MKNSLTIVLAVLFLSSCKNEEKQLISYFHDSQIDYENYEYLVVIPYGGCSSCVKKAFDFLDSHYEHSSTLFVVSNVNNLRLVRLKVKNTSERKNVIIDATPNHLNSGLNRMYPYIIYINKKGDFDIRVADPYNSEEWDFLKKELNQ